MLVHCQAKTPVAETQTDSWDETGATQAIWMPGWQLWSPDNYQRKFEIPCWFQAQTHCWQSKGLPLPIVSIQILPQWATNGAYCFSHKRENISLQSLRIQDSSSERQSGKPCNQDSPDIWECGQIFMQFSRLPSAHSFEQSLIFMQGYMIPTHRCAVPSHEIFPDVLIVALPSQTCTNTRTMILLTAKSMSFFLCVPRGSTAVEGLRHMWRGSMRAKTVTSVVNVNTRAESHMIFGVTTKRCI